MIWWKDNWIEMKRGQDNHHELEALYHMANQMNLFQYNLLAMWINTFFYT